MGPYIDSTSGMPTIEPFEMSIQYSVILRRASGTEAGMSRAQSITTAITSAPAGTSHPQVESSSSDMDW